MSQPPIDRPPTSATATRLARLVARARAADLWERLWRGIIPPLVVAGVFVCVSWLGLWLVVPHSVRAAGLVLFAVALALSTVGLWRLTLADRRDALKRIDASTGLSHRPASALDDHLASAGRDPATDALWALHRRRAEADLPRFKVGLPSPRAVDLDRYALRAGIVVALFACALVAGPQRYARLAAAFDIGGSRAAAGGSRLDAWIDPPPYTGKAPVLLDLAAAAAHDPNQPQRLSAPIGSTVIVRWSGDDVADVETSGPLLHMPAPKPREPGDNADKTASPPASATRTPPGIATTADKAGDQAGDKNETRLVLHGDSHLVLRQGGALRGSFDLVAVPDQPPTIALREIPKVNARGSLKLAYTVGDDYGVSSAEALFSNPKIAGVPTAGPSLVDAPRMPLSLPGVTHGIGDGETTADLSEHPWAGTQVTMVLVARDEGGNEGRTEPVEITLPQKPFNNPLARALVEQRRTLVLEPNKRATVADALDAMMIEPEAVGTTAAQYLGLRFAADKLAQAHSKPELVAVADYLWGMALQIENGDLSEAERALRQAEKELRDAIDRHASDEEIQKLTQNLQTAMDKFLKELAEQQKKDGDQQAANSRPSKSISPSDLQKLIERLKQQSRSGNREEAKKALDELQDILENLKTAKKQKADPQQRAMAESLNQLDQMMRDQQDLRDETFKQGQQQNADADRQGSDDDPESGETPRGQPGRKGSRGQRSPGSQPGSQAGQGDGDGQGSQQGSRPKGQGQGKGLGDRQQALRDRLDDIQKKLKKAGQGERSLGEAGDDMHEAEDALKQGEGTNGQAVDAQGRALEAMRKGAKKLADAMKQGNEPGGQSGGESEGSQAGPDGQQTSDADPLGRPRGGQKSLESNSRFDPMGVPAAQRAQRVLEELRRRLSDPARAQEEIDYLERLLRSY